jgi:carbamate kinase
MLVVVALGGNALARRGEPLDVATQRRNLARAVTALAELVHAHDVVVTHGNGPQVGLLALQAEALPGAAGTPLDVLGAESEGMIGYLLEQELANAVPGREVATLLTRVVVAPDDPAFAHPTKPVGPVYTEAEARQLAVDRGWTVAPDGTRWRRVVASPEPLRIVELRTIRLLLDAGVIVVCAGGGGIPVTVDAAGGLRGVEAVVDKDRSAALLAEALGADALLLLTDVAAVDLAWGAGGEAPRLVRRASPESLSAVPWEAGSMGPKVEAACGFVRRTGRLAAIGALEDAAAVLGREAGTTVVPTGPLSLWPVARPSESRAR